VAGRLHDDVAGKAEMVAQRVELLARGVAGRIFAFGRVRIFAARSEHVAMRVDGAGGHLEARL
jgi:hypothetical protein